MDTIKHRDSENRTRDLHDIVSARRVPRHGLRTTAGNRDGGNRTRDLLNPIQNRKQVRYDKM
jgi:hypothetical protein